MKHVKKVNTWHMFRFLKDFSLLWHYLNHEKCLYVTSAKRLKADHNAQYWNKREATGCLYLTVFSIELYSLVFL